MSNQRISAAAWRERVEQWHGSSLPVQAYADQCGLPAERLKYWARRLEREAQAPQLVPVRLQGPVTSTGLELRSPSCWTMHIAAGADPAWLASLLQGLR
jgi:hypothetical protein